MMDNSLLRIGAGFLSGGFSELGFAIYGIVDKKIKSKKNIPAAFSFKNEEQKRLFNTIVQKYADANRNISFYNIDGALINGKAADHPNGKEYSFILNFNDNGVLTGNFELNGAKKMETAYYFALDIRSDLL